MRRVCEILDEAKNIVVYGISNKPARDSRSIAIFLKNVGYNVVGVNPIIKETEIEGITVYRSLKEVPFKIDILDVFRRSEAIPEIIPDVLEIKPKVMWLQLGIQNDDATKQAEEAGVEVIQNRCIMIDFRSCR